MTFCRDVGQTSTMGDIKEILRDHCNKVMISTEDDMRNYVNVRRGNVVFDGINKINRLSIEPNLPISVKFADDDGNSEGAVDIGGPTREFFRLAINEMVSKVSVFQGSDENKILVHNVQGNGLP